MLQMGKVTTLTLTPATNTAGGAHTAGDAMAAKLTLDLSILRDRPGTPIYLLNAVIQDLDKQDHDCDLLLFSADLATTVTPNDALDVADADLANFIGSVNIDDYMGAADNGAHFRSEGAWPVPIVVDHNAASLLIYGVLVTRGTPTYSGIAALKVKLTFGRP